MKTWLACAGALIAGAVIGGCQNWESLSTNYHPGTATDSSSCW